MVVVVPVTPSVVAPNLKSVVVVPVVVVGCGGAEADGAAVGVQMPVI